MKSSLGDLPYGCGQGSEDANGAACRGSIVFGLVYGTADSFRCCELVLLSVAI